MKLKEIVKNFPVFTGAVVFALICIVLTAFTSQKWLAIIEFLFLAAVIVLLFVSTDILKARKQKLLSHISSGLDFLGGSGSNDFPLPVAVCSKDGEIIWFNNIFEQNVTGTHSAGFAELTSKISEMGLDTLINSAGGVSVECDGKSFNIFSHGGKQDDREIAVMYFIDNTNCCRVADEFIRTRPSIIILTIDNINEIQQDYRESDCNSIKNGIEKIIETWVSGYPCFVTKVSDSKFYIVAEKQDIDNMIVRKFDILDYVRQVSYDGKYVGATLSIGVGNGANLSECEKQAKLALDMALGRGGDQAVVKTKDNYEFFGGVSKSVENNNKVKSRIVASALSELIAGADNVFIMGHRFPDFDAVGSALGVAFITKCLGKNAYIVCDTEKSMAKPLFERVESDGFGEIVVSVEEGRALMGSSKKNLLVIVDTHIKSFVESTEMLEESQMTVVIDHHRKAVDYIGDAVIFFHDPSASSTAEMVTELIEYTPEAGTPDNLTADGLMAGIMLDTKNFILRSSSRTFEAAAFLKSNDADTVRVKKLFANDIESCHLRNEIIGSAKKFRNCAIAVSQSNDENIRIISAQAADELLNVSGVDASFVIFALGDMICVSARSMGAVNVQVLMEQMGGGGHQTMAAAQIKNTDIESVAAELMHNIEKYNEK